MKHSQIIYENVKDLVLPAGNWLKIARSAQTFPPEGAVQWVYIESSYSSPGLMALIMDGALQGDGEQWLWLGVGSESGAVKSRALTASPAAPHTDNDPLFPVFAAWHQPEKGVGGLVVEELSGAHSWFIKKPRLDKRWRVRETGIRPFPVKLTAAGLLVIWSKWVTHRHPCACTLVDGDAWTNSVCWQVEDFAWFQFKNSWEVGRKLSNTVYLDWILLRLI